MINKQKGQSLIETLVALAMAAIIMSAIALTITTAINSGDFAKRQNLATQYAQQGLEIIKQDAKDGSAALSEGNYNNPVFKSINDSVNKFARTAAIITDNTRCGSAAYVKVTVAWTDGKCSAGANCHNVILDSCIVDSVNR